MEISNASQAFSKMNFQLNSHSYDIASKTLISIDNDLYPSFCFSNSRQYNNLFAQNTAFYSTIELNKHQDPDVQKAAQHFLHRWSFLISSLSPIDFLTNVQGLIQKNPSYSKYIHVFMPALGNAVSLLSDDEVLHNFPLIQKLFHFVPPNKQIEVPKSVWQAIGKFSPEDEIMQLLRKNLDIKFASIAPNLIQKNPKKFTNILFKEALSAYLNEFLQTCPQRYRIDIDEALNRVNKDCSQLGSAGFNSTCQMLGNLIHYNTYDFTEQQQSNIKSILNNLYSFLSDERIVPNDTNSIISTLIEGVKKNLFEKDQLKKLLPTIQCKDECPQLQITLLKLSILCMEKGTPISPLTKKLLTFSPWLGQISIQYLEVIGENYSLLKEVNCNLVIHILWSIFHPLPLEETVAVAIVKFLLKLNPTDILELRVDARLDYLFDAYFKLGNFELSKLTLQLAKQFKYSPSITKIDLSNNFCEHYISLLKNADTGLIKELATSGLVRPQSRHSLLTVMQNKPDSYSEFVVPLVNVLYAFSKVVGIINDVDVCLSRCGLQKPEITEEIITVDELKDLFTEIDGPIEQSSFVTFLSATLDTFCALSNEPMNRTKVNQNNFSKAALIASNLILLSPKHVLGLLTSLQKIRAKNTKDLKKKKKDVEKETNSAAAGYNEAFRIVETTQIPIKYSVDFVLYANSRYDGYSEISKQFPKYINEALGKSRMISDMFRKELKQPLQPMKTFLSFVGIKEHQEWVNVCQVLIPPHEWMLRAGDAKLIDGLKSLSQESKRILGLRFAQIKNMPKPVTEARETYEVRSKLIRLKPLRIAPGPAVHLRDTKAAKSGRIPIQQIPINLPQGDASSSNMNLNEDEDENDSQEFESTEFDESNETTSKHSENSEHLENSKHSEISMNSENSIATSSSSGTLYEVISFLWHSKLELPESISFEALENLALSHSKNPKMLIGFFSWASTHNQKINLEKWEKSILVKRYTPMWYLAIAMFASNIHCPFMKLSASVIKILQKCLTSFGYPAISKSSLVHGYYHLTGVKWLIVRNIISIDVSFFHDYPLVVAEMTRNFDIFKKYIDELDTNKDKELNEKTLIGINDIIMNPSDDQLMQTSLFPTNRTYHNRIMTFKEMSTIPSQIEIPQEILYSIINVLQKAKNISNSYFYFFMNIKLSDEQFERVSEIFFKDKKNSKFLLPSLYLSECSKSPLLQEEAIQFYIDKPPSFTRAFFRSLICPFVPPANQDLITKIECKLESVFPDFCYNDFAKNSIKMWSDSSPISTLRFGRVNNEVGSALLNDMKVPSYQSIVVYNLLCSLQDDELARALPFESSKAFFSFKGEMSRILLETASSDGSNVFFTLRAVSAVFKNIGIENAMILIAKKEFFQRPNFLCVVVAFLSLKKAAQNEKNQNVLDFIQMFQNPETSLIQNENRKKIFLSLNSDESLSSLIHSSY